MITWNNLDTLESYKELSNVKKVNLVEAMTGENGAERVKNYSVLYWQSQRSSAAVLHRKHVCQHRQL